MSRINAKSCWLLLLVVLGWAGISSAQAASLSFDGTVQYSRTGTQVRLQVAKICNTSTGGTSGTVYIGLWATQGSNPVATGYLMAQTSLQTPTDSGAQLAAGRCFTNINFTTAWTSPPNGTWYVHFFVTEYPHQSGGTGGFTIQDSVTMSNLLTVGGGGGGGSTGNTALRIDGAVQYDRNGSQVRLRAEKICNTSTNATSGTVYIGLWATAGASPIGSGRLIAQTSLQTPNDANARLAPNACFTNMDFPTTWTSPPDGSWYVHFFVTEFPNQSGGTGGFRIIDSVTFSSLLSAGASSPPPPLADDHGNTTAAATAISVTAGGAATRTVGQFEQVGDVDVFRFTLAARQVVTISTESSLDTTGSLRNSAGTEITSNDDSPDSDTALNFRIEQDLEPGTYFIQVGTFEGMESGPYTLVLSSRSPPGANASPVAQFSATPAQGSPPLAVTLTAFSSSDTDGQIVRYEWAFGDGSTPLVVTDPSNFGATHTYTTAGTYTITLTVTDNGGASASTTRTVTVQSSSGGGGSAPPPATDGGGGGMKLLLLLLMAATLLARLRREGLIRRP